MSPDLIRLLVRASVECALRGAGVRREGGRGRASALLFSAQLAFLGVHAAYGWCPPVALLRRMGFRTQKEIQAERELVEASLGNGIASKDRRMADV